MNGSNNCNFQAVSTNCFDSIKIANNSNHSVDLNIDESGNQEAILLCPSENIVETSIIQTSNNSIEVQIFDTQTYHDANTSAETNKDGEMPCCHAENLDTTMINYICNSEENINHQEHHSTTPGFSNQSIMNDLKNDSEYTENPSNRMNVIYKEYHNETVPVESHEVINSNCNELTANEVSSMETEEVDDEFEIYKPIEICSLVTNPSKEFHKGNFFKGCKWAPDGTCLLTNSNDNYLRTFDPPSELHCKSVWRPSEEKPTLNYSLKMKEGGIIYDFVWYPKMNSAEGFTSYFLSSSMNAPIHLWDSVGGQIQATYRPYNQVDEVTHAYSLAFSPDGNKIFAGFMSELKVFSTDIPGRQCTARNLKPWFRKSIVSAIAVNPIQPDICALGTYSRMIGLFSESDGKPCCFLKGHRGGITHLSFASDGILLYSGARMDSEILCWDLRNPGCVLYSFPRAVSTNQRIYFDLSACSTYVLSGNTNGDVSIWNVSSSSCLPSSPYAESVQQPLHQFTAHQDCTNGVGIHPFYPILGTTSGQRHIPIDEDENQMENNLKLWWIGR